MTWNDVAVKRSETTFGRVQKDSEEELGKRICTSGSLIQINAQKLPTGKVFTGLLDVFGEIYQVNAVGSSGSLEGGSYTRFCGVVTGNLEYSNTGGGTSKAVVLVGMFDLKENKPATTQPKTARR